MGRRRFGHIGTKVKDITQSATENSGVFDINEVAILVAENKWKKFNTVPVTIHMGAGGGGGGAGQGHSGWGYFRGAGGGAGGYITGTGEHFYPNVSYAVTIGGGGGGQSNGNDTTLAIDGATLTCKGGGRGGNGSGNYQGSGTGSSGGSGGGGGTVFANVRPYDSHGYNAGQGTQDNQTVPSGFSTLGNDGGKGNRGSGFSDGNPPPGRSGGSASGGTYNQNSTGKGAGTTVTPLGYEVCKGGEGNTANRGHGGTEGHSQSGGSGFVYILFPSTYTCTATNLGNTQGTYAEPGGDTYKYIHITSGTGGTIVFS
tara:strand:- start:1790 stop:2728 length:939 start_codon:yes stop_codon:yes gene_type:complete